MVRPLVVKVTCGSEDAERANQGFTVAAMGVSAGAEVSLWLTGEAAWFGVPGRAEAFALPEAAPLADLLAGVRLALARVRLAPGRLVVAGHSAGAALAADYAAVAASEGLPVPAAVFSIYPGRKLRHLAVPIPTANLAGIARGTRLLVFAGERDTAVGTGTARRIAALATQADTTLRIIDDDEVDEHSAPRRFNGAAQRTFWAPLDALVEATAHASGTADGP
jgi:dienelactone hydrolase